MFGRKKIMWNAFVVCSPVFKKGNCDFPFASADNEMKPFQIGINSWSKLETEFTPME